MTVVDNLLKIKKELLPTVELVAVSKFHPVEPIRQAYEAGQRIFGESRPQELFQKVGQLPQDIRWHFIGHLQTNKLKMVLPYVELVHSVDSVRLLEAIRRYCENNGLSVDVLIEVHIAQEETKSGFSLSEAEELLTGDLTAVCGDVVRVRGLMAMASLTDDEALIRREFQSLTALYRRIGAYREAGSVATLAHFDTLSFGMSNDYHIAMEEGATLVRIGTDIFGPREY